VTNRLIGHAGASPRTLADALLVRAVSRHQSGLAEEAAISLRQAIGVLDQYGLRMPLALVPRESLVELLPHLDSATRLSAETLLVAVPSRLETSTPAAKLTSRELAVLAELTHEPSTQAIAASLFVSPNTVKSQIRSIYRKLGVSTRAGALAVAETMGLLPRE
jgi:LuxR family maltose regulon positive regulatory protein